MLKLRKVEVAGFKSFSDRTQIAFSGTGLTCIIGPNGCGKSNIVDAISWVLGEQSHKSLRAERMSDCIFNGTAKRPPMGLAEVTLTLVDPELAEAARKVLEGVSDGPQIAESAAAGDLNAATPEIEAVPSAGDDGAIVPEAIDETAGESLSTEDLAPAGEENDARLQKFRRKKRAGDDAATQAAAQMKIGEVVIGRRLYRSGQSEYLLNGRTVRLRDVQELFMGIGLGPNSYAIIEQGRIGQILSTKPSDRRAIIEEAAGITKFKTKRRLSEAKLESSKINLSRVNDILVEVEKQLGSLKRQASRARRYTEMRDQMRGMLRQVLGSKARELDSEAARLERALAEIAGRESHFSTSTVQLEAEQERLSHRVFELDDELRQNQNLAGQAGLELDRSENRIVFNGQRSEELDARIRQLRQETELLAAQTAQVEARVREQQESLTAVSDETARLEAIIARLSEEGTGLDGDAASSEARIAELRAASERLAQDLARLHGEQAQAGQDFAHQSEAVAHSELVEHRLLEESLDHRERAEAADLNWKSASDRARHLEQSVREAQARIGDLRRQQQSSVAHSDTARSELAGGRARRATLSQILDDRSYTAEAVQKLFAANGSAPERGFRAVGVLADYVEVQERYETAVEQFLREELEYVVVDTFDVARAGIAMLQAEVGGRATFFVDSLRTLNLSPDAEPPMPFEAGSEVVARLDQLVEFRDPLGPLAKRFLPRLGSAYLVETAAAAEKLARENPAQHFLTADGTCYQGRMVSGGRPTEAGPLVMKRELRELDAEVLRLEREASEAQAALSHLEIEIQAATEVLDRISADQMDAEKAVVGATHLREQQHGELARLGMELTDCQNDLARLRAQAGAAQHRVETAAAERTAASAARDAAEREIADTAARISELRQRSVTAQQELSGCRADLAQLLERRAHAAAESARLAEEQQELSARRAGLDGQAHEISAEREQIDAQTIEQQQKAEALRVEKTRLEERKLELEREWEAARTRGAEVDDTLRMARQTLGDLREERGRHEIDRARNDSEREHLRQACVEELNAQPEDLIATETALLTGEELRAADALYHDLKTRIESMGPINMMALEEFNECEGRFGFLSRERDDLLQSITDTQQAIAELDLVCRQKFEEAFHAINAHFATAFHTMFGGGHGEMRLSEPDSSGEAGIDIAAQPPGKRLQNVLLLSGGEKALTALALLIAVFRYQPSPFCILDEVDAPLDEANVGRFTQMVREMSAGTQFIVVTHNRRTMEMASVLYGVTMQEPGVSKLVSVRWDEPAEQRVAAAAANAA
ncbi:MAG: chromosome segregation protein SMC [Candidatus Acidiferrales bacterium]